MKSKDRIAKMSASSALHIAPAPAPAERETERDRERKREREREREKESDRARDKREGGRTEGSTNPAHRHTRENERGREGERGREREERESKDTRRGRRTEGPALSTDLRKALSAAARVCPGPSPGRRPTRPETRPETHPPGGQGGAPSPSRRFRRRGQGQAVAHMAQLLLGGRFGSEGERPNGPAQVASSDEPRRVAAPAERTHARLLSPFGHCTHRRARTRPPSGSSPAPGRTRPAEASAQRTSRPRPAPRPPLQRRAPSAPDGPALRPAGLCRGERPAHLTVHEDAARRPGPTACEG